MMKRTIQTAIALIAICILGHASAVAGMYQYKFDSGICEDGTTTWVFASLYVSGIYAWSDGVDCEGHHYHGYILCAGNGKIITADDPSGWHRATLLEDPTLGLIPTHSDVTDVGPWRSIITRNPSGIPMSVAGVAEDGTFYRYEVTVTTGSEYH